MTKQKLLTSLLCAAATCLAAGQLVADDEIKCKNGSLFVGDLQGIDDGIATIKNSADDSGENKVKQSEISSITSAHALNLRLKSGETVSGTLGPTTEDGKVQVGGKTVAIEDITSSWLLDGKSPEQREEEKYEYTISYEAGVNVTGTTGNTESINCGAYAQTDIKNAINELKLYVKYNYGKTRDDTTDTWTKSADNLHAGFDFTSEFSSPWFWYARTDLGYDKTQNIKFFDLSAAGFGVKIINEDDWHLSVRGGISYRYESYHDYMKLWGYYDDDDNWIEDEEPDNTNTVGMDFGLSHDYAWDWGKLVTEINYVPGFDDFLDDYYIFHETYLQFDIKNFDQLFFRIGVKNEYRSQTAAHDHLDTTYYLQLVFEWK